MSTLTQIRATAAAICQRMTLDWSDPVQVELRRVNVELKRAELAELAELARIEREMKANGND